MDLETLYAPFEEFRKTRAGDQNETTVIRLAPGATTTSDWNKRNDGNQMILVLEGEMIAETGGDRRILGTGGTMIVGAGVEIRLSNEGDALATAFAVAGGGPGDMPGN